MNYTPVRTYGHIAKAEKTLMNNIIRSYLDLSQSTLIFTTFFYANQSANSMYDKNSLNKKLTVCQENFTVLHENLLAKLQIKLLRMSDIDIWQ